MNDMVEGEDLLSSVMKESPSTPINGALTCFAGSLPNPGRYEHT
jgi:hypothetical protein